MVVEDAPRLLANGLELALQLILKLVDLRHNVIVDLILAVFRNKFIGVWMGNDTKVSDNRMSNMCV